jgi:pantoate--beta-alanine ligase
VVVSIFVNPTQFGPNEDFRRYPRNLKRDAALLRKEGVDALFYPQAQAMYPEGHRTFVEVEGLSDVLCGRSRPGHFRGVATVVTKLFNIVGPRQAYFGQKDAQQAAIIKRMVTDLNMPVKIKVSPIVREADGLALSSRNVYLNKEERSDALILSKALRLAESLIRRGVKDSGKIIRRMTQLVETKKRAKIDYISIVDLDNLKPVDKIKGRALIALEVRIGKTRLIDNTIIRKW